MNNNIDQELLKELSNLMEGTGKSSNVTGNVKNSVAKIVDEDGTYVGDIWNGMKHGEGVIQYNNGNKYVGEWRMNGRCGQGTMYYNNGRKFIGFFKDNKAIQGTMYYTNGDRFEGQYQNGKKNGQGTMYYANGDRFKGQYQDGKRNGQGTYYWDDGDSRDGYWRNGIELNLEEEVKKLGPLIECLENSGYSIFETFAGRIRKEGNIDWIEDIIQKNGFRFIYGISLSSSHRNRERMENAMKMIIEYIKRY